MLLIIQLKNFAFFFLFTFFWLLLINRPNINNQEEKVFKSFQFSATSHTFKRTLNSENLIPNINYLKEILLTC